MAKLIVICVTCFLVAAMIIDAGARDRREIRAQQLQMATFEDNLKREQLRVNIEFANKQLAMGQTAVKTVTVR